MTFGLLLVLAFTGSVVIPIKALLLNVPSLMATLSTLVWIFQDGHLQWLVAVVFASFVSSGVTSIRQLGFGVAFAILLDATVCAGCSYRR